MCYHLYAIHFSNLLHTTCNISINDMLIIRIRVAEYAQKYVLPRIQYSISKAEHIRKAVCYAKCLIPLGKHRIDRTY